MWQRFGRHQGMLRASALSFDTTLALVPVLALVFVMLQTVGVQELVEPFILQQLTGNSSVIAARVHEYVGNTRVAGLGSFSTLLLIFTLLFLLESIREAFNAIWGGAEQRSLLRRCLDYLLVLAAVPLLLTTAIGMTSLLQSQWLVQWLINNTSLGEGVLLLFRLTPFFCSSLVLVLVYLLLPGVKVRFASALTGGVAAGACWQLAHWVYFRFQFGVTRYNAIYGALSLLPFLLIWIYTSWLVVLLGFELVRCHQQGGFSGDEVITAGEVQS